MTIKRKFDVFSIAEENTKEYKGLNTGRPKIKMKGKEIDIYDLIQAAREDTEIYPTLEKYGCIDKIMRNNEGIFADLTNIKDLRNSLEQMKAAEDMWLGLPLEVRAEYNHSIHEFLDEGQEKLTKQIKMEKEVIRETPEIKGETNEQQKQ